MKNTGVCPKCAGDRILEIPGTIGAYGAGNNVPVGWRARKAVPVGRFVCGACGYAEEWVVDPQDLARLRDRYGAEGTGGVGA